MDVNKECDTIVKMLKTLATGMEAGAPLDQKNLVAAITEKFTVLMQHILKEGSGEQAEQKN